MDIFLGVVIVIILQEDLTDLAAKRRYRQRLTAVPVQSIVFRNESETRYFHFQTVSHSSPPRLPHTCARRFNWPKASEFASCRIFCWLSHHRPSSIVAFAPPSSTAQRSPLHHTQVISSPATLTSVPDPPQRGQSSASGGRSGIRGTRADRKRAELFGQSIFFGVSKVARR